MPDDRTSTTRRTMSPSELYVRTGRRSTPAREEIEYKFNPWHDPANGRFTFAQNGTGGGERPDGSWGGGGFTGGGGGSGGGAGATGTWEGPAVIPRSPSPRTSTPTSGPSVVFVRHSNSAVGAANTWHTVAKNGYSFRIDAEGRTREVTGAITLGRAEARSRSAQAAAGGADRLPTDDGGHYIAQRFNGPSAAFNHFAQDANFNRGGYKALESSWAKAVAAGSRVKVNIGPIYFRTSKRPAVIYVSTTVNGHTKYKDFINRRGGK